jgi:L-fuconolactonase
MKIDAHQHFWRYSPSDYGWIDDRMAALRRDFLPDDLQREIAQVGVEATIAVQARQSLSETEWLLELANQYPIIGGVVGWFPLAEDGIERLLEKFARNRVLKGVRHVVQDEPDDAFLENRSFNAGVTALRRFELVYDILIYERQLPQAIAFVDRHPNQPFVLDHLAKPLAAKNELEPWAARIRELARRESVMCKVSGLATESSWNHWDLEQLRPYLDTVLEAFGPRRLMFGSDWPVCLIATTYSRWHKTIEQWAQPLTGDERTWLFGKSAATAYNIDIERT